MTPLKIAVAPAALAIAALAVALAAGCNGTPPMTPQRTASATLGPRWSTFTPTPAPGTLYVDHNGVLYRYHLPLSSKSKPLSTLKEAPDQPFPPQIAVSAVGSVAIGTPEQLRFFTPPIGSFDVSHAKTVVPLTPAVTQIGPSGAELVDLEYDPNLNLWLINNLGGEITELQAPVRKPSTASVIIEFNVPGTKTNGYAPVQARFDINANLYVYAENANGAQLFKTGFPYGKPPSPIGLNIAQVDWVDPSQYSPSNPNPAEVVIGQYSGPLASPHPQQPPPPPVDRVGQFLEPFNPVTGIFPNVTTNEVAGALVADPIRAVFYTLDEGSGKLEVYPLPLTENAAPKIVLPCSGGIALCDAKPEHLFLAP